MSERLQEAIAKARREREGAIGLTQAPPNYATAPANTAGAGEDSLGSAVHADAESTKKPAALKLPDSVGPADPPAAKARETAGPAADVHYHRTRQVELCAQSLFENKVIAASIDDPQVGAYRQLRSQVLNAMRRNHLHTLAITSAREGAGKTLTCVNLAISISLDVNQTVLLVDLDLSKPDVANTLGITVDKGIVDHLSNGEPLENILLNPGYPRLVIIPGKPQGKPVSEMLSSPEMTRFLGDITSRYPDRIILFDLPPLLRNDDAMVFVPNADACLFVVEDGVTRPDEIEHCFQLLKHSKLIGTILNKAR